MNDLADLEPEYVLRGRDPSFAIGLRSRCRYACGRIFAYYHQVNPNGPQPLDYISYAKTDLEGSDNRAHINALGNAKRAVHLTIDAILRLWALDRAFSKKGFPLKADLLVKLEVFPTRLIRSLNHRRNIMEHEYTAVTQEAADFVDVAEMFVRLALPYTFHATTAAYVGLLDDDICYEWRLNHSDFTAERWQVDADSYMVSEFGRIHHNLSSRNCRNLIETIPLRQEERDHWLPVLNLFSYLSMKAIYRLPIKYDEPGDGMRFVESSYGLVHSGKEETA